MKKRFLALVLTLVMLTLSAVSCSGGNGIASSKEESRVVGTCGGYDVKYEELRYLVMTNKEALAQKYGEEIFSDTSSAWVGDYLAELEDIVDEQLRQNYAALRLFKKEGIKPSDKVTAKEVNGFVESAVVSLGGEEQYLAYLESSYMTDAVNRFEIALYSCISRYSEAVADDYDKEAYDAVMNKDGLIRVRNVKATTRADAEHVLSELDNGKTFNKMIGSKYNKDTKACDYHFFEGTFDEAYEQAALALDIGEISPIVETSGAFYILERLEPDDRYVLNNIDYLKTMYINFKVFELIEQEAENIEFELNEYGKTIDLWQMK